MREHRLRPLVNPRSIAVLGATRRADAVGNNVIVNLLMGRYPGNLYAVNPGYSDVLGVPCFPTLAELPTPVEHVIFTVNDMRIEAAVDEAIKHGIRACTIFSSLILAEDRDPPLRERLSARIEQAGVQLAGANSMGFYNFSDGVWAGGFDTRQQGRDGNVVLLSQSGAGMSSIVDCEERLQFSFAASTGHELLLGVEDFLDYVLDQPQTEVVGLFLETSRKPAALRAALDKANQKGIPVVAVKVGQTDFAAQMAESHSGALAGMDGAFEALFDYYGVQRVNDLDELATALIVFAQPHAVAPGALVTLHDSGGERQLMIDQADRLRVPLNKLEPGTVARLEELLDPGLPAVNPLDAWSAGGADYHQSMAECFATLMRDPGTALGAVVHARAPMSELYPGYFSYLDAGHRASGKPVFLVAARQGTGSDDKVLSWTRAGYPVLDGVSQFLVGARCLMNWRDHRARETMTLIDIDAAPVARFCEVIAASSAIDEHQACQLLLDCGIPMTSTLLLRDATALEAQLSKLRFPVVLKTAMPGIHHKSDHQGVVLNIRDADELRRAYQTLADRLGPHAIVAPMIEAPGVEMILGIANDSQFGALVVMGFGGVHAEVLQDITFALPPFDAAWARHCIDRLSMRALLDGSRGTPVLDIDSYCEAAARLSSLAHQCCDLRVEIDINPIRVMSKGCIGLDALILSA